MCIRDRFGDFNEEGQTILMVTHSTKAASCANRIMFIKDGEVFNLSLIHIFYLKK